MTSPSASCTAVDEDIKERPSRNTMEGRIYNGKFVLLNFVTSAVVVTALC
jgi:hypothetical protein